MYVCEIGDLDLKREREGGGRGKACIWCIYRNESLLPCGIYIGMCIACLKSLPSPLD